MLKKIILPAAVSVFLLIISLNPNSFTKKDNNEKDIKAKVSKSNINVCKLKKVERIPKGSLVFIGHAYGAPILANEDSFLADKVSNFLNANLKQIDHVIFTGDVFEVPTVEKWQKISTLYSKHFAIDIAPGNHDVGNPQRREIYSKSDIAHTEYPHLLRDYPGIIIEDSTSTNWKVSSKVIGLINETSYENYIVARHNIPVSGLVGLANSREGASKLLDNYDSLINKIDSSKKVTWIMGDSGAFPRLPSVKCIEKGNHRFIVNGIGGVEGDAILVYNNYSVDYFVLD